MRLLLPAFSALITPFLCLGNPAAIQTLRDFELNLVASNIAPLNPLAIDWDSSGQMWVAVTSNNPMKPRTLGRRNSILVLGDSNGDGIIETRRTFATRLRPVGSFVFHRDGVIIAEGQDIIWLRDRNGDSRADTREVLFSRFGTASEPARITSFRRGLDGWIYAVLGRGSAQSTTIKGPQSGFGKIGHGIFRFKSNGRSIETVSAFPVSVGSIDFSWDGELFFSQADGPHASHVGLPESWFARKSIGGATSHRKIEDHQTVVLSPSTGRDRVHASASTSFIRPMGAVVYDGGAWPERYQGNFYVCDPAHHIVHEDVISRPESAYFEATRRLSGEFVSATDQTFSPFELRVGPDGAIYILDCQNRSSQPFAHSPRTVALHSPGEECEGRIWRLQHRQPRRVPLPSLAVASPDDLAHALEHPNNWVRQITLRLLTERADKAAVPTLEKLLTSSRFPHARVAALWALHHLDALSHGTWTNALEDPHPGIQKNAWLAFVESNGLVTREIEKIFEKQFKDADERVRLAALRAIAKGPLTPAGRESLAKLFPDLKDNWSKTVLLAIARQTPMEFIRVAFASDKSENFRELVVPLVEQLAMESGGVSGVLELAVTHAEKAEKLSSAVREALVKAMVTR